MRRASGEALRLPGRDEELAAVTELLDRVQRRLGGVLLLAGEPGIGKSRLAEEAATLARQRGLAVAWGRCREQGATPPLWPFVQVLRGLAVERVSGRLPPVQRDDVARLLEDPVAVEPTADSASARFRLFDSVARTLVAVAEHTGLLVVLDDLHRADASSLGLLAHVCDEIAGSPVAVLGTYRDGAITAGHPLGELVGEPSSQVRSMRLTGLDPVAVHDLLVAGGALATVADDDVAAVAHAVWTRSGGNPFFVSELVRYLRAHLAAAASIPMPPSVRETIGRRLMRLSSEAQVIIEVCAVLGRDADRRLVLSLAQGVRAPAAEAAIEELSAAGFLRDGDRPGWLRFSHDLVHEAVYERATADTRSTLHAAVVRRFEAGDALVAGLSHADLAFHARRAARAAPEIAVAGYARRAAREALGRCAYEDAARFLSEALDASEVATDRNALRCELGDALRAAGDTGRARATFLDAAADARARGDGVLLATAALGVGSTVVTAGRVDHELVALLEETLEQVADPALHVRVLSRLAIERYWSESGDTARALSAEALARAERLDDRDALAHALYARLFTLRGAGPPLERRTLGERLLALAVAGADTELEHRALTWTAPELLQCGDGVAYRSAVDRLSRLAEQTRLPVHHWYAETHAACAAAIDGRLADALARASHALQIGIRIGAPIAPVYHAALVATVRRDVDGAGGLVGELEELARSFPYFGSLRSLGALLRAERGDRDDAAALLRELGAGGLAALPRDALWLAGALLLGEVAVIVDDEPMVEELTAVLAPFAGACVMQGIPNFLGSVDRVLGRLATARGRFDEAAALLARAEAVHRGLGARALYARTLLDRARLERARGGDAAGWVQRARTEADAIGAKRLAADALAVMPEGGAPQGGPADLSPREREVLALVAGGASNREVADALVISVHTVERHLANVYAKLGVRSRSAATAWAHRSRLV